MVWSVTRAIGASAHGAWYGHSVLCLTVSRQLSPRKAVSPTPVYRKWRGVENQWLSTGERIVVFLISYQTSSRDENDLQHESGRESPPRTRCAPVHQRVPQARYPYNATCFSPLSLGA